MTGLLSKLAEKNFGKRGLSALETRIINAGLSIKPVEVAKISIILLALFAMAGIALLFVMPLAGLFLLFLSVVAYRAPAKLLDFLAAMRRKRTESELPFALRYFSQLLSIGLTPEGALSRVSRMDFGEFSRLLACALGENRKGKMLEAALLDIDRTIDSERMRETVSVIIQTLRLGPSEEGNRITLRLAHRMMEQKKGEYEGFAARSQVLLVVQVAVSAIIPAVVAFFAAFGGFLGGAPLGQLAIYSIFLFVLPALSLFGLLYMKLVHPG